MLAPATALSLPAMFAAGLAASAHCALMCGPLHAVVTRGGGRAELAMQLGRLCAYAALGAVAGGAGTLLLRVAGQLAQAESLRMLAAAALLAALLVPRLRSRTSSCCRAARRAANSGALSASMAGLAGLATGLMPCALLYSVAAFALFSGTALSGAMILLAFGLGTLPGLRLGASAYRRLDHGRGDRRWKFAAVAAGLGGLVLMLAGQSERFAAWCLTG